MKVTQRDDPEVLWAAIAPPRPCHSMAWSGGISIIYIVNLLANKRALTERVNRLCARCCTQHLTHTPTFPRLLQLHISMCLRKSLNRLVLSANANARYHPSCCSTKVAPPVPSHNSPFHIHSRLLCHRAQFKTDRSKTSH
jgi:hypothetical protein